MRSTTDSNTNTTKTTPVHGTGEWAAVNINIQQGCEHNCLYCFACCQAVRFKRSTPLQWGSPSLRHKVISKSYHKRSGTIMFPTTHDISALNLSACETVLTKLLSVGNNVLIVSKPHLDCIEQLCRNLTAYKAQILFRFTIGSADDAILRYWEPHAPSFEERLSALRFAHSHGYQTSVSCEPMLDLQINRVIDAVRPYVTDAVWLGRVNRLRPILAINRPSDMEARQQADKLLSEQTDEYLRTLYIRYQADPLIKWKDSIKKVVGLDRPTQKGLDI